LNQKRAGTLEAKTQMSLVPDTKIKTEIRIDWHAWMLRTKINARSKNHELDLGVNLALQTGGIDQNLETKNHNALSRKNQ
jgi:hypothetical protein